MGKRPLFQNSDEQEAAFAPEQLPENTGDDRAQASIGSGGDVDDAEVGLGAATGLTAGAAGTIATAPGAAPAAIADATEDQDTRDRQA